MIVQRGISWELRTSKKTEDEEVEGGQCQGDFFATIWNRKMVAEVRQASLGDVLGNLAGFWDQPATDIEPGRSGGVSATAGAAEIRREAAACHTTISGRITSGGKVEVARGGRLLKLRVCSALRRNRKQRQKEWRRGKVRGFSPRSRMRLLEQVCKVDQASAEITRWRFVTLTYQNVPFSERKPGTLLRITREGREAITPRNCKRHLRAFLKKLSRKFGPCGVVWKLEPQRYGMPHFHLLVLLPHTYSANDLDKERDWFASAWVDVINGTDEARIVHRYDKREDRAGWQLLESWEQVTSYTGKYVGKVIDVPNEQDWENAGRWWGIENRHMLPMSVATALLNDKQTIQLQRAMRRWSLSKTRQVFSVSLSPGQPVLKDGRPWVLTATTWAQRKALRSGSLPLLVKHHRAFIGKHCGGRAFMPAAEAWRLLDWVLGDSVEFSGDDPSPEVDAPCPF